MVVRLHLYIYYEIIHKVHKRKSIGALANFFLGGLSHLCTKSISIVPEKTAMLTCKIVLPHRIIGNKNPGFRALRLAGWSEFRFLAIDKYFFIFRCWLLPKKFSVCLKNDDFARLRALQPLGLYAC